MQHRNVEGHRDFVGQVAIEIGAGAGGQHGGVIDHHAVGVDDFPGKDFRAGRRAEPFGQLGQYRSAPQPYPGGP